MAYRDDTVPNWVGEARMGSGGEGFKCGDQSIARINVLISSPEHT